jgi:hypothetical protein
MAKTSKYHPHEFQQCTIDWVTKRLITREASDSPRRFLVADEVGLGKTIVAKHTIKNMESAKASKRKRVFFYVCSSLDIARQNRKKLVDHADQVIEADRINLLYSQGYQTEGTALIGLTPSTSMNFGSSLGSARERLVMAQIVQRFNASLSAKRIAEIFVGQAKPERFLLRLKEQQLVMPPDDVSSRIYRAWSTLTTDHIPSFEAFLTDTKQIPKHTNEMIRLLRFSMASTIFSSLKPDLIILDEFQRYKDLIAMSDHNQLIHPVGRIIFGQDTPVLLLSATPYTLFRSSIGHQDGEAHTSGLSSILHFLTGKRDEATKLAARLQDYGKRLEAVDERSMNDLVAQKQTLETDMLQIMSRTERVRFESHFGANIQQRFMSDTEAGKKISGQKILEYLLLADSVDSPRTLLSYWKSGNKPLSYQGRYKLVENAVEVTPRLKQKKELYTSLANLYSHTKLNYILQDATSDGAGFDYLWLPPSRPYYQGSGIFASTPNGVEPVKKALIFSSWQFVPRLLTAELAALKNKRHQKYATNASSLLKPTPANWARFLFPSPMLVDSLTHDDFVGAESYSDLHARARQRIEAKLGSMGVTVDLSVTKGEAWEALKLADVQSGMCDIRLLRNVYTGKARVRLKGTITAEDQNIASSEIQSIWETVAIKHISSKTLDALADIAISSPSVCIVRAAKTLLQRDLNRDEWSRAFSLCFFDVKNFFNRDGHVAAIKSAYNDSDSYPILLAKYLRDGNFQAVIDEYFFLASGGTDSVSLEDIFHSLQVAMAPRLAKLRVPTGPDSQKSVLCDVAACLADVDEESDSKENLRVAFNSPFWPFVLSTTAVGQEGLDFHQYCKDIYHWNLPSNPVDFEQREGRINRFRNMAVRKSMVEAQVSQKLGGHRSIWEAYFADSYYHMARNDRYNLGLSPNWIYTSPNARCCQTRHIMDLVCSDDPKRFDRLMRDLALYRLALGQSDQEQYLKKLRQNEFINAMDDVRGLMLCFFPKSERDIKRQAQLLIQDHRKLNILLHDAQSYLDDVNASDEMRELVSDHSQTLLRFMASHQQAPVAGDILAAVETLYYFVHPHDDVYDQTPLKGLEDDLERLRVKNAS